MNGGAGPVSIVILTWNGLEYTRSCLESLRANTDYPDYCVVVVDNGSTDGTIEYLEGMDSISLIRNSSNLGFARGNNIGIRSVAPDRDVVLLNNDTEIRQRDWLSRLQASAYRSDDIGIAGCRLARPDATLQHAGAYMPLETFWGQQLGGGEKDINQYNEDRDVESVVFACVYLKRRTLDNVGLLDEDYFSYFEDTDYCHRAAILGYRTVCCGSVTVIHHENVSTKVNSIRLGKYFEKGQRIFRDKWEKQLRATRYTRELSWHSILNFPTGYGISSRHLVSALDRHRVFVSYRYVYGPGTVYAPVEPETSDSYVVNLVHDRKWKPGGVQVVYAQANVFESNSGKYRIGYSMLETDRIPKEWVRQANLMDEVWVPSRFNEETFRASGVTRPIHVVPLGTDTDYFNPAIAARPLAGVYVFLSVFEWGERKAPELLLRAFNQEFRADEPVLLLAKVINVDPAVDVGREVARMNLDPRGGRIDLSLNQVVPTYQLGVLYRSADCFVLPTRGEGWGMPIIEAMACGLPVIATDWGAHRDFMTEANSYPLPVERLVPAHAKCPYYTGFRWADPSFAHLRRLMRHVFENQEEARATGSRAARDIRENWTWDQSAAKIIERLDAVRARR